MELLVINGHDYSRFVERKGLSWSRNDIDSEDTTRTKNGTLRRVKICAKRKMAYTMMNMTQAELAQMDNDLSEATFSATYLDLHGVMTRTFYCSSLSAIVAECNGEESVWESVSFSMTEV